jgi:hypothetical protein
VESLWAEVARCRWEERRDSPVGSSGRVDSASQFREPTRDWYFARRIGPGGLSAGDGIDGKDFTIGVSPGCSLENGIYPGDF